MDGKKLSESWTVWWNVVTSVVGLAQAVAGTGVLPVEATLAINVVGNLLLRLKTTEPLAISGKVRSLFGAQPARNTYKIDFIPGHQSIYKIMEMERYLESRKRDGWRLVSASDSGAHVRYVFVREGA